MGIKLIKNKGKSHHWERRDTKTREGKKESMVKKEKRNVKEKDENRS